MEINQHWEEYSNTVLLPSTDIRIASLSSGVGQKISYDLLSISSPSKFRALFFPDLVLFDDLSVASKLVGGDVTTLIIGGRIVLTILPHKEGESRTYGPSSSDSRVLRIFIRT